MSTRWLGWLAAVLAMLITLALVVVELTDAGPRRWWESRPGLVTRYGRLWGPVP